MKKLTYHILILLAALVPVISCSDDFELTKADDLTTVSPPSVSAPEQGTQIELLLENADQEIEFSWTSVDYGASLAISYELEIAETGTDFADAYSLYSGAELSTTVAVSTLNTILLNKLGLEADAENSIDIRVASSISSGVEDLVSETKTISITPYATSFPPIYMIGAATGGWDTSLAVEVPSSAPNVYSTIWKFEQNETFRFFGQANWNPTSYNYPYFADGSVTDLLEDAGDGDNNFMCLGETGYYRITVNLKTLTVEMEAVDEPVMYMTGAGIGGWDEPGTGHSIKMTFVKENVWKATADFTEGEAWRFFAQAAWSPTSYNYPYFAEGTVADMFEDAGDGDNNFNNKSGGTYVITLNLNDLSVSVSEP